MVYNLTGLDNATDFLTVSQVVNNEAGGYFFAFIMLCLWIVLIILFHREDLVKVMLGSSFLIAILGAFLLAAGLIPWVVITFPTIAVVGLLLIMMWRE